MSPGAEVPWVYECLLGLSMALVQYNGESLPPIVTCYLVEGNLCCASR